MPSKAARHARSQKRRCRTQQNRFLMLLDKLSESGIQAWPVKLATRTAQIVRKNRFELRAAGEREDRRPCFQDFSRATGEPANKFRQAQRRFQLQRQIHQAARAKLCGVVRNRLSAPGPAGIRRGCALLARFFMRPLGLHLPTARPVDPEKGFCSAANKGN